MLKILNFSIFHKFTQMLIWGFVFMAVISPSSILVAQDDVEEYWGDDEEYDEHEDEDEYLDDDEYEDEEEYEDEDEDYYEDDEDDEDYEDARRRNNKNSGQRIEDAAERLGYTVDLTLGSPRFVNPMLMYWNSTIELRASVEFPVLMQVMGARFRFGAEAGNFKFTNANYREINGSPVALDATFSGITLMGIMSFPAGPGKIKIGAGMVGSSFGYTMESSYGIRIGSMEIRGGIRSTEAISGKTADSVNLGRVGWMDGQIVLGINL